MHKRFAALHKKLATKLADPIFIRRVNGYLTLFWIAWFIPAIAVNGFRNSVFLVAVYSIWANIISHYTAWLTARVEVRAERVEIDVENPESKAPLTEEKAPTS